MKSRPVNTLGQTLLDIRVALLLAHALQPMSHKHKSVVAYSKRQGTPIGCSSLKQDSLT